MNEKPWQEVIADACKALDFPTDVRPVFQQLRAVPNMMEILARKLNVFQHSGNAFLLDEILAAYAQNQQRFLPMSRYHINKRVIESAVPTLCLSTHANFSPISALVVKKNRSYAMVAEHQPTVRDLMLFSGVPKAQIPLIGRDSKCLVNVKRLLDQNYFINCPIDYRFERGGVYDKLGDGMLSFAQRVRTTTILGTTTVNNEGELVYRTELLNLDVDMASMKHQVMQFIQKHKPGARYEFEPFDYARQKAR